ncbi:zinc finger protein 862-like [Saccoglossus kowalevskii]
MHQKAEGLERDNKENHQVDQFIGTQVNLQKLAVEGAMKCIYWLAKNEVAHTTKYVSLLDFVKSMGCTYLEHLDQGGNANYTSERIVQEFLLSISGVITNKIYSDIQKSPVFGTLMDETTDIAIMKQLITYTRYITVTGNTCEVKTSFTNIDNLVDGKADTIMKSTEDLFNNLNFDFNKCTSLGSDGAAVMVGKNAGVAAKLKEKNSSLINVHCVAHRLALAAAQAMNGIRYLKRLSSTLQQLFYFYQNSSVRMAGLAEIQKILGESDIRLKDAKAVRWLSHQRAVNAIRRSLPAVITSLEREASERDNATAAGLVSFIKDYQFIASIHMLSDVLPHLSRLSLLFQPYRYLFLVLNCRPSVFSSLTYCVL